MRKLKTPFLLICLLVCSSFAFSQSQGEHLTFKGISIKGTVESFANKMIAKGYQRKITDNNYVVMHGDFVGEECDIYLLSSPKTNIIWKVGVFVPESSDWYELKHKYFKMKEQLKEKYGECESFEFFRDPYYEGDGYEMQAIRNHKCSYTSFFETSIGSVCLQIDDSQLIISYEDSVNSKIMASERDNIIKGDL